MSDFELPEERGWAVYNQSPRTGKWRTMMRSDAYYVAEDEAGANDFASDSSIVEEVTIRPVCLGADPVQVAAVQMATALFGALNTEGYLGEQARFRNFRNTVHALFGGSLEREP